jgi:membrane dipeptidase
LPDAIRERGGLDSVDIAQPQPRLHTDLARLAAGAVTAQFWAAYLPVETMDHPPGPAVYALEQIDVVHRLCRKYPAFAMALTAADIERNFKAGKISCLIGIEGGHAIQGSLGALRMFYALGGRYMTLTHNRTLDWADAAVGPMRSGGLSPFGEDVVREMNRLGMLVDLSHVADATMIDAIRVSRAPVIYSHSSARALTNHVRNVPDSILRLMPANGGLVMVNFNPPFVSEEARRHDVARGSAVAALRASGADSAAVRDTLRAWNARAPKATLAQVADHIDHIRRVAGVDHVGLGSDFDGISAVPVGLEDVSKFPDLIAELLRRGWKEADVVKLLSGNALRVMRRAEAIAER